MKVQVDRTNQHWWRFRCPGCEGPAWIKESTACGECDRCGAFFACCGDPENHLSDAPEPWLDVCGEPNANAREALVKLRHSAGECWRFTCPSCWASAWYRLDLSAGECDRCQASFHYLGGLFLFPLGQRRSPVLLLKLTIHSPASGTDPDMNTSLPF
jgi:hypothetical protein